VSNGETGLEEFIKTLAGPEYTYEIINIFFVLSFYNELMYQIGARSVEPF